MRSKICTKCKEEKSFDEFHKDKGRKDGLQCWCKGCIKQYYKNYAKQHHQKNKEDITKRRSQYYQKNKEAITRSIKQWRQKNKEAQIKYNKQYRKENKEVIAERSKKYRKENKEAVAEIRKRWKQNNSLYDTHAHQIDWCEEVRRDSDDLKFLQIRCVYCNNWFNPTNQEVQCRIEAINSINRGSHRFYCSKECKKNCPCFDRVTHRRGEDFIYDYNVEVRRLTERNFIKYYNQINPKNLKRGVYDYHIDHIYSIQNGFKNGVLPEIIANPFNLRMLWCTDNYNKHNKSDILIEKLYETYNKWKEEEDEQKGKRKKGVKHSKDDGKQLD